MLKPLNFLRKASSQKILSRSRKSHNDFDGVEKLCVEINRENPGIGALRVSIPIFYGHVLPLRLVGTKYDHEPHHIYSWVHMPLEVLKQEMASYLAIQRYRIRKWEEDNNA